MKQLIQLFLKLGATGFGGPIALLGMMEVECVQKRKWISIEEFQRFVGVAKLLPGPLAALVAVRIGCYRNGKLGGLLAGLAMILPSFFMVLILALLVKQFESNASLNRFWVGLGLGALAVAIQATVNLTKPLFKKKELDDRITLLLLVVTGVLTFLFPRFEVAFILSAGLIGLIFKSRTPAPLVREVASLMLLVLLFWSCFRASIFTFGSGIAIVPVLRTVFIDDHHWITNQDFLRGLTLGQITPGPLIIISTYLGYVTAHLWGALASTLGTFSPTFILGIFVMPAAEVKILHSEKLKVFFSWLLPAVCGAIFGSLLRLMLYSVMTGETILWPRILLVICLTVLTLKMKIRAEWIFLIGGVAAYAL